MPEVAGLITHVTITACPDQVKGHHQVQHQRRGHRGPIPFLHTRHSAQHKFRGQQGGHRHRRQKQGDAQSRLSAQVIQRLIDISGKAVIPAILHNHTDVIGQIRLEIAVVIIQWLNGLHIIEIQAGQTIQRRQGPCQPQTAADPPIRLFPPCLLSFFLPLCLIHLSALLI